tara:strand:+ start:24 stop:593 length:570 start_codon:yes stop_codon:yes gene_type:complete
MAISINGNGTITGISVGGLPDGIVDTDMLAAGAATAPKRGAGSILQTVFASEGNIATNTTTSYADTGLSATITPSSSSNKIQVMVSQPYRIGRASASDASGAIQLYRSISGSEASVTGNQGYLLYFDAAGLGTSNGVYYYNIYSVSTQDSPNTTSAVTYLTKARTYSSSTDIKTQYNGAAYITLMEIAA